MTHLDHPWINHDDPLRDCYGTINIATIHNIVDAFPKFHQKEQLLKDFTGYYYFVDFCQYNQYPNFDLLHLLFNSIHHKNELFCYPWDYYDSKKIIFEYDPPMMIKTYFDISVLQHISSSFIQMQNGSYALMDKCKNFYSVIFDGYYAIFLIKKTLISNPEHFDKNWHLAENNLDKITYLNFKNMFELH
ncbi:MULTISPECIES: hypothetical protein [unclassified Moraxella]|uniref:hypothetical protein n=1 Tax=unclassified Moraxella TaxID=2685852 RepID=UPI00359CE683